MAFSWSNMVKFPACVKTEGLLFNLPEISHIYMWVLFIKGNEEVIPPTMGILQNFEAVEWVGSHIQLPFPSLRQAGCFLIWGQATCTFQN